MKQGCWLSITMGSLGKLLKREPREGECRLKKCTGKCSDSSDVHLNEFYISLCLCLGL